MMRKFSKRALQLLMCSPWCLGGTALADRCTAEADFERAYPTDGASSKFKFKFRVASDDCTDYGCTGYIHYRIHYRYSDGDANAKHTLTSYRIPRGQRSRDITDETYPSSAMTKIQVQDVEITEVSCTTP